jgi:predicted phage tail protein
MRTRSFVLVSLTLFGLSACGGGSRTPAAPSSAISIAGGAPPAGSSTAAPVSWSCFTSSATAGSFGPAGCATRLTTARLLPTAGAPVAAPDAPTNLTSTVSGSVVTLSWTAAATGEAATSYQIQAGSSTGQTNIATFDTGSTATSLAIFNVPAGTYFVRVRAVNSIGASAASNEVQVVVGGPPACASISAPSGLTATIVGTTVTLSWGAPSGCAPTSYIIQAGSAPGLSNLANFSTGSTATTFTAAGVGAGTYYVRVLAAATGAQSAPSTEIAFTVGVCGTVPGAPTNLQAAVTGSTVVFTWTAPAGGCAPTSYVLQAGSTSGASNLASVPVSGTSFTAAGVADGTYYVRVVGVNAVGPSAASNEVVLTLPQQPTGIVAAFDFFDPSTQASATTVCNIVSEFIQTPSVCQARSRSFTTGTTAIVSYDWTIDYVYGTRKIVTQTGTNPVVSLSDTCGGPGSSTEGTLQPVTITLTVTDSVGAQATAISGVGSQPALQLRLFRC